MAVFLAPTQVKEINYQLVGWDVGLAEDGVKKLKRNDKPFAIGLDSFTTAEDKRIIDAVSIALKGRIGDTDDVLRLYEQVSKGSSENKLYTACEIAIAFIRFAQDMKERCK